MQGDNKWGWSVVGEPTPSLIPGKLSSWAKHPKKILKGLFNFIWELKEKLNTLLFYSSNDLSILFGSALKNLITFKLHIQNMKC